MFRHYPRSVPPKIKNAENDKKFIETKDFKVTIAPDVLSTLNPSLYTAFTSKLAEHKGQKVTDEKDRQYKIEELWDISKAMDPPTVFILNKVLPQDCNTPEKFTEFLAKELKEEEVNELLDTYEGFKRLSGDLHGARNQVSFTKDKGQATKTPADLDPNQYQGEEQKKQKIDKQIQMYQFLRAMLGPELNNFLKHYNQSLLAYISNLLTISLLEKGKGSSHTTQTYIKPCTKGWIFSTHVRSNVRDREGDSEETSSLSGFSGQFLLTKDGKIEFMGCTISSPEVLNILLGKLKETNPKAHQAFLEELNIITACEAYIKKLTSNSSVVLVLKELKEMLYRFLGDVSENVDHSKFIQQCKVNLSRLHEAYYVQLLEGFLKEVQEANKSTVSTLQEVEKDLAEHKNINQQQKNELSEIHKKMKKIGRAVNDLFSFPQDISAATKKLKELETQFFELANKYQKLKQPQEGTLTSTATSPKKS